MYPQSHHRRSPLSHALTSSAQMLARAHPYLQDSRSWPVAVQELITHYTTIALSIRRFPATMAIPPNLHGLTVMDESHPGRAVIWIRPDESPLVQRFTLAHEFGHVLAGHIDGPVVAENLRWTIEVTANAMAAEILLPWSLLSPLLPSRPITTPTAWRRWWASTGTAIVHRAEVSPAVLYYHCIDLNVLLTDLPRQFA